MAKLVIIFACVALLEVATALECYFCIKEKCDEAKDMWQKSPCNKPAQEDKDAVCASITFKDKTSQKEFTKRSCELVPKGEVDKCTVTDGDNVVCKTCTTDLCNSASNVYLSGFALTGLLVAYLVPKFLI